MAKYSEKTQDTVEEAMHKMKKGTLKSGSGKKVKSRKQAIAIGLSEAREKGYKVPAPKTKTKLATTKKTTTRKTATKSASKSK